MPNYIDGFYELCIEQPFNAEKINTYIHNNKMTAEDITCTAIKVCDYGMFSYGEYLCENNKEPMPQDLVTYNWEALFNVFIENGLEANLVICDNGIDYENILQSLRHLDDGDLNARILRNVLSKSGTPNFNIDNISFFEEIDSNFMTDIQMGLYPHKWQLDNAFRFWLVLIGFGGVIKNGERPINMRDNNSPGIFKEFEKFDYHIISKDNDFELQIINKQSGAIVATV